MKSGGNTLLRTVNASTLAVSYICKFWGKSHKDVTDQSYPNQVCEAPELCLVPINPTRNGSSQDFCYQIVTSLSASAINFSAYIFQNWTLKISSFYPHSFYSTQEAECEKVFSFF